MFLLAIIVPFYAFAVAAVCCMDTAIRRLLFVVLMLIATFLLFLFIQHPMPSALSILMLALFFTIKIKD